MAGVDPRGPVFISYCHSDGTGCATELAWALRAAGVPVWLDETDLLPGHITGEDGRLAEALDSGLSGGVLVVTQDVGSSEVIKREELPKLLELSRDPSFTLGVASSIIDASGRIDYRRADDLLGQPAGTLSNLLQRPVATPENRAEFAHEMARGRMHSLRADVARAGGVLTLDVQTRGPVSARASRADVVMRLRPHLEGDSRPHRAGLEDLQRSLKHLPGLLDDAGASTITVSGRGPDGIGHDRVGAHLSVAFALGAAFPTTLLGEIQVVDRNGVWVAGGPVTVGNNDSPVITTVKRLGAVGAPLLAYVDLTPKPNDAPYEEFRDSRREDFSATVHVRNASDDWIDPARTRTVVDHVAGIIREQAGGHQTGEVHLLLRCPFGIAFHLGRSFNTLRVHVYEFEKGPADDGNDGTPRYLPSLVVRSGAGGGPVEQVTLPMRPTR